LVGPAGAPGAQGPIGPIGNTGASGAPGSTGATGPQPWQTPPAAWTASTAYTANPPASSITYSGESYVCSTSHTSTSTFDSTKWTKIAAKGADGSPSAGAVLYTSQSLTSAQQDQVRVNISGAIASNPTASATLAISDIERPLFPTGAITLTVPNGGAGWRSGTIKNANTSSGLVTLAVPSGATLDGVANGTTILRPYQRARVVQTGATAYVTDWVDQSPVVFTTTLSAAAASVAANLPVGYSSFEFTVANATFSTASADFGARLSNDGGATWKAGSNYYNLLINGTNGTTTTSNSASSATYFQLLGSVPANGNPALVRGTLSPGGASALPLVQYMGVYNDSTGAFNARPYGSQYTAALLANAVQFFPTSGNMNAGTAIAIRAVP
jgi:hypothetical protein